MQIHEVCLQTGLTKKAIEYYQSKGLISPLTKENGYRDFTADDLEQLKTIALLRKLDLTTDEIKQVLNSQDSKAILLKIKQVKQMQAKAKLARLNLIEQLAQGEDIEEIQEKINLLDQQATIKEKLLMAFPGFYARYISIHFGRFLNEPIKTADQKSTYATIVDFLDNMDPIEIPEELQTLLASADDHLDDNSVEDLHSKMQNALDDFETYWANNKTTITQYTEFKKSPAYQNTAMAQLMSLFHKFGETSGYYDIFIPAMRKLSPAYNTYYEKLLEANDKLSQKITDLENCVT